MYLLIIGYWPSTLTSKGSRTNRCEYCHRTKMAKSMNSVCVGGKDSQHSSHSLTAYLYTVLFSPFFLLIFSILKSLWYKIDWFPSLRRGGGVVNIQVERGKKKWKCPLEMMGIGISKQFVLGKEPLLLTGHSYRWTPGVERKTAGEAQGPGLRAQGSQSELSKLLFSMVINDRRAMGCSADWLNYISTGSVYQDRKIFHRASIWKFSSNYIRFYDIPTSEEKKLIKSVKMCPCDTDCERKKFNILCWNCTVLIA